MADAENIDALESSISTLLLLQDNWESFKLFGLSDSKSFYL